MMGGVLAIRVKYVLNRMAGHIAKTIQVKRELGNAQFGRYMLLQA